LIGKTQVGVLGATCSVGQRVLERLSEVGSTVTAYSRKTRAENARELDGVSWRQLRSALALGNAEAQPYWICAAPIWVLPEYFPMIEGLGAKKIVAISSTSRFTKETSSDPEERATAKRLANAENTVSEWAEKNGVACVILQPTLIYGHGRDKNIAEIARFIRRFGFFPVFGKAQGLRQPLHVDDLASACVASLTTRLPHSSQCRVYAISGAETLPYREMVRRVFEAMGRPARILSLPLVSFRAATWLLRHIPRYRHWTPAMAERMNRDMAFDHSSARRDFGFSPRPFQLDPEDTAV
jgi:nucleoside-diphosphate-sugar epimerase